MEYPPNNGGVARYLASIVSSFREGEIEVVIPKFFKFFWPKWLRTVPLPFAIRPRELWISHLLPLGYIALIYKIISRTPYTIFVHGTDVQFAAKSSWKRFWAKIILSQAKQIITNSQYTLSLIQKLKIKNLKLEVVYPCPTFSGGISVNKKLHTILSVGRLVARKGFDIGIMAAIELKKEFPELTYTIIGNGPEETKLKELISKNNAGAYIKIITKADDAMLEGYYAQSAILLAPGREIDGDVEGFGLVILEAAQFGTPAVATNVGGVGEAIINGQTGILIPNNNVNTIIDTVRTLLKNNELRQQMGEAARQRVAQDFNIKEQVRKISSS